jgi:hypothetical protein
MAAEPEANKSTGPWYERRATAWVSLSAQDPVVGEVKTARMQILRREETVVTGDLETVKYQVIDEVRNGLYTVALKKTPKCTCQEAVRFNSPCLSRLFRCIEETLTQPSQGKGNERKVEAKDAQEDDEEEKPKKKKTGRNKKALCRHIVCKFHSHATWKLSTVSITTYQTSSAMCLGRRRYLSDSIHSC